MRWAPALLLALAWSAPVLIGARVLQGMRDLVVLDDHISFEVDRPGAFFSSPVPLRYRSPEEIPIGTLGLWDGRLPESTVRDEGRIAPGLITLRLERGERVFRRISP